MKMIVVVFQLLGITIPVFCESSGLFAVVQRRNGYMEDTSQSAVLRFNRRRSIQDHNYAIYENDAEKLEHGHKRGIDMVFQSDDRNYQDSAPERVGRFAMEYEVERNVMRSAENPLIQHRTIYNDNADGIINNAYRSKPAALFHSKRIEEEAQQRQSDFRYRMNDSVFI